MTAVVSDDLKKNEEGGLKGKSLNTQLDGGWQLQKLHYY